MKACVPLKDLLEMNCGSMIVSKLAISSCEPAAASEEHINLGNEC